MSLVYLIHRLPWPTPWQQLFGRSAPLIVEMGFGSGHFLTHLAQTRPDCNVIGVEIATPSIERTQQKVERLGLSNVKLIYGNGRLLLRALCLPASISELYLNFPDPWYKPGHLHRRLITDQFLELLATRMPAGAKLEIATDHPSYQTWITDHLIRTPYFETTTNTPFVTEDNARPRTKYERQALDAGVTCHYYKYQRNTTPPTNEFPILQELPMPHAMIRTPLKLAEIAEKFQPVVLTADETHVRFMVAYAGTHPPLLLIETFIHETPLEQHIALQLQPRHTDQLLVSLHPIGFPRVSAGTHIAIRLLAQWIIGLHPQSTLLYHNLRL